MMSISENKLTGSRICGSGFESIGKAKMNVVLNIPILLQ
jgi:hypothetical protein